MAAACSREPRSVADPNRTRHMSGISLLLNRATWVDVQGIAVDDRRHVEIRRYRPAPTDEERERPAAGHPAGAS